MAEGKIAAPGLNIFEKMTQKRREEQAAKAESPSTGEAEAGQ